MSFVWRNSSKGRWWHACRVYAPSTVVSNFRTFHCIVLKFSSTSLSLHMATTRPSVPSSCTGHLIYGAFSSIASFVLCVPSDTNNRRRILYCPSSKLNNTVTTSSPLRVPRLGLESRCRGFDKQTLDLADSLFDLRGSSQKMHHARAALYSPGTRRLTR